MLNVLASAVRQGKNMKDTQIGKEEKLLLFAHDVENPETYTPLPQKNPKKLELINEFTKIAEYTINEKSWLILYNREKIGLVRLDTI